ncbi:hypothetical protein Tco_1162461 [Tanacetum coccineum]
MTYPFHWFSEQVGLAGDLGSTNDVLIPLVEMDDSNLTMEEYIELEAKKSRRRGQMFNWKTATYRKLKLPYPSSLMCPTLGITEKPAFPYHQDFALIPSEEGSMEHAPNPLDDHNLFSTNIPMRHQAPLPW